MATDHQPDDPFASLSLQLVSHGYLNRPLLLSSLLSSLPSLPSSSSSSSSLKKHQDLLLLRARSLDQITKLLWNLLERNQQSKEELKESVERESRAIMEFEREKTLRERTEKEGDVLARELEKERAKSKDLETKLKAEQEKHKHVREELVKSRNALQFIRTQALHDQKKREQEVTQLHLRLSKLGSSSTSDGTRIQILNGSSVSSSSPTGSPLLSTLGGRGTVGSSSRRNFSTPPAHPQASAISIDLLTSEIELLKSSLEELDQNRLHLTNENLELREFLGDLTEWVERLLGEEEELYTRTGADEGHVEGEEAEQMDPERLEAKRLLQTIKLEEQREIEQGYYSAPNPHLSSPPSLLVPQLHKKLYILRLTLLSSLNSVSSRINTERQSGQEAIEREIAIRDEALEEKRAVELELEEMKGLLREGELLVDDFTKNGGGKPRPSRLIGRDDSGDELPEDVVRDLEEKKKQKKLRTASSKLLSAEIEKPSTSSSTSTTTRPSIPSQSVQDFLGSLGLDTPAAAVEEKASLKSNRLAGAGSGGKEKEKKPVGTVEERRRVSNGTTASSSSSGSKTSRGDSKGTEKETFKKPSTSSSRNTIRSNTTSAPPPSTSSAPSVSTASTSSAPSMIATETGTSAALSSILSLALSPPPTSEPLVSSHLQQQKVSSTTGKSVLGSSRAVNGGGERKVTKNREELIKEKKASLLAAHRGGAAAVERR